MSNSELPMDNQEKIIKDIESRKEALKMLENATIILKDRLGLALSETGISSIKATREKYTAEERDYLDLEKLDADPAFRKLTPEMQEQLLEKFKERALTYNEYRNILKDALMEHKKGEAILTYDELQYFDLLEDKKLTHYLNIVKDRIPETIKDNNCGFYKETNIPYKVVDRLLPNISEELILCLGIYKVGDLPTTVDCKKQSIENVGGASHLETLSLKDACLRHLISLQEKNVIKNLSVTAERNEKNQMTRFTFDTKYNPEVKEFAHPYEGEKTISLYVPDSGYYILSEGNPYYNDANDIKITPLIEPSQVGSIVNFLKLKRSQDSGAIDFPPNFSKKLLHENVLCRKIDSVIGLNAGTFHNTIDDDLKNEKLIHHILTGKKPIIDVLDSNVDYNSYMLVPHLEVCDCASSMKKIDNSQNYISFDRKFIWMPTGAVLLTALSNLDVDSNNEGEDYFIPFDDKLQAVFDDIIARYDSLENKDFNNLLSRAISHFSFGLEAPSTYFFEKWFDKNGSIDPEGKRGILMCCIGEFLANYSSKNTYTPTLLFKLLKNDPLLVRELESCYRLTVNMFPELKPPILVRDVPTDVATKKNAALAIILGLDLQDVYPKDTKLTYFNDKHSRLNQKDYLRLCAFEKWYQKELQELFGAQE